MKNFTYRSSEEKENIEAILRQRRRKMNRQQLIAGSILGLIILGVVLYFGYHTYYTEYDGYVHVDANRVRTPFDIYLDSVYVKTGDIVAPGDTLYSYYMLDLLVKQANPDEESNLAARNREISLRYENTKQQINVLKVRMEEIQRQIAIDEHNISFGLNNNTHKLDLERALKEDEAKMKALRHEQNVLYRMKRETSPRFNKKSKKNPEENQGQIYDNIGSSSLKGAINYRLAGDSSIVTKVNAPKRMIFFTKEEILTTQHLNLDANNLQVVAYVPVEKIHKLTQHSKAEVVVTDKVSFNAHVSVLGLSTDEIPANLQSYFTKRTTALIAVFNLEKGQTAPFWSVTSGLPVTVRVKNHPFRKKRLEEEDYLWFTTGEGIRTHSRQPQTEASR
ncbi:MAG: M23 family metallopeptidase [Bacteroidales bacterium]|nr:M23 family metallopeptidase [Bacteroidales bacterium]